MTRRFAVFASGSGTNLQALIDAVDAGRIRGAMGLVLTNRPGSGAQTRAERHAIPLAVIDHTPFASRSAFDAALAEAVEAHDIDLIVLAGFMRILTPTFVQRYAGRIVNIHPSLLPAFKGKDAIGDALSAGVSETGVTVHFVNEDVDSGAIIAQQPIAIRSDDTRETLLERVHAVEHRLLPEVVDRLLQALS